MITVRTTIRLRKDLFEHSKFIAFKQDTTIQDVINNALAAGFGHITDLDLHQKAITDIDKIREDLRKKKKKFNVQELIEKNKKDLEQRTKKLLTA